MQKLVIGLDPEFLTANEEEIFVCPQVLDVGPKRVVKSRFEKAGGFNRDGMAIELNPSPTDQPTTLTENLRILFADAQDILGKKGFHMVPFIGANIFDWGDKKTFMPDVYEGGCDPDFNAYTREMNHPGVNYARYPYRFCGGHIHVSAPFINNFDQACEFIQKLRPLSQFLAQFEDSVWSYKRREVYGKEGDFRWREEVQRIEYRTPDSSWIWEDLNTGRVMPEVFKIIGAVAQSF